MREGGQINIAVFFYFGSFDPLFLGERGRKNMAGSKKSLYILEQRPHEVIDS